MNGKVEFKSVQSQLVFDDSVFPLVVTPPVENITLKQSKQWIKDNLPALEAELAKSCLLYTSPSPRDA